MGARSRQRQVKDRRAFARVIPGMGLNLIFFFYFEFLNTAVSQLTDTLFNHFGSIKP